MEHDQQFEHFMNLVQRLDSFWILEHLEAEFVKPYKIRRGALTWRCSS